MVHQTGPAVEEKHLVVNVGVPGLLDETASLWLSRRAAAGRLPAVEYSSEVQQREHDLLAKYGVQHQALSTTDAHRSTCRKFGTKRSQVQILSPRHEGKPLWLAAMLVRGAFASRAGHNWGITGLPRPPDTQPQQRRLAPVGEPDCALVGHVSEGAAMIGS